ncbi:MAG: c-type cytochrome [Gemmatimonadales bacterium]
MTHRRMGARRKAGSLMTLASLVVWTAACDSGSTQLAAAGAQPASTFYIGPQPGPDQPLARAVNPYAGHKEVLADGRQLFNRMNCSGCHGDHGGGGMGPSLRDSLWYYGGDDAAIFASITEGRDMGMPAWGSKLPRDQIWKIVTYIKSMRTPNEPDPPR